jgi:hypothetical protein
MSYPARQEGRLQAAHSLQDNLVGFTCREDYSISVDIDDKQLFRGIQDGTRRHFTFVFTPVVLAMMGRFFCKVGVELVCRDDPVRARSDLFRKARRFARQGEFWGLWPIFHFRSGSINGLKEQKADGEGIVEEVLCYKYRLLDVADIYTLLVLTFGTDTWVTSLNDPYPTPSILRCFPEHELSLTWYSPA